jgi:hypothetical protein
MRRKTEILKYKSNASNTKTNSFTKVQHFTQLVNGPKTVSNYNIYLNRLNNTTCPNDETIPTPTSSSNVPGPIVTLKYDPTIPLYKYTLKSGFYSYFSKTQNTNKWYVLVNNNVFCQDGVSTKLFSIYILDTIDQTSYNFTFQTPFAISIMGNPSTFNDISLNGLSVGVSSLNTNILYNGLQVPNQNIQITNTGQTTSNFNITDTNQPYNVYQYSGILTISNIVLNTTSGFVYDFYLQPNMSFTDPNSITNPYTNYYNMDTRGIYCNLSEEIVQNSYNTVVTTNGVISSYVGYSLTGV